MGRNVSKQNNEKTQRNKTKGIKETELLIKRVQHRNTNGGAFPKPDRTYPWFLKCMLKPRNNTESSIPRPDRM